MSRPVAAEVVRLEAVGVSYRRRHLVFSGVSLSLVEGETLRIFGANGSGKTTLLRVLAGACRPNTGRRTGPKSCAFVPATVAPPPMSVGAWLERFPRRHRRDPDAALRLLGFDEDLASPLTTISFGNLRKVLLAEAATSGEALVLIDDATAGLDPVGLDGLHALLRRLTNSGTTVVVSDQDGNEVATGVREVRILDGRVISTASTFDSVEISFRGPESARLELEAYARRLGFVSRKG